MNIEPEISEPKCTQDSAMESEMSLFLQEAAETCCESRTIFQAQAMEDQNKLGDNFCSSSGKKRRLTLNQVKLLERNFIGGNKLEHDKKVQIAKEIGLQPRQVAVWFQNRRARSKTKKMENDYDSLNNEYDKLKKDFDNLLEENQRLKAEVDELRGKQIAIEKMKNNPSEPVEAMDSSVTEFGKTNTMGSCRQEEGSRSSSKSDAFYSESESPAMENQSQLAQAAALFQDEEDDIEKFGRLNDGSSVDELMDSYYNIITAVEDQPFFFWSQID